MKKTLFSLLFCLLCSCSKSTYLIKQGIGQMDLLLSAEDNEKLIKSSDISDQEKDKIQQVIRYKQYFERFFKVSVGKIYDSTALLKRDAVTYLVVVSPYDRIEAMEVSFPFYGSFPYLGFFSKKDAIDYKEKWDREGYFTYMRPVLAYSSLGTFNDPILSPFFHYSDYELAELIFHELFHSIFFIKNNVELNENLASFFASKMTESYFELGRQERLQRKREREFYQDFVLTMSQFIEKLNERYREIKPKDRIEAKKVLKEKWRSYQDEIRELCAKYQIEKERCYPLKREWNNASLAALGTYSNKMQMIEKLYRKNDNNLKKFYFYLKNMYEEYKRRDIEVSFTKYLSENV